jgi:hypothetical protein
VTPGTEPSFTFDEASHTYWKGGVIIPGATRCLDHAGLTSYENVRADVLERRSRLGKIVHQATHFADEADLDVDSLGDETRGYVMSWVNWRAWRQFQPLKIEHRQLAELNGMPFGMQIDRLGTFARESQLAVVEIKITREIYDHHGIQLAFYAAGCDHSPVGSVEMAAASYNAPLAKFLTRKRVVVQLRSDGKKARERFFDERNDFEVATWALGITHWKLNHGKAPATMEEENT